MNSKKHYQTSILFSLSQTIVSAITLFLIYRYAYKELGAEAIGLWSLVIATISIARISESGFTTAIITHTAKHFTNKEPLIAHQFAESAILLLGAAITLVLCIAYIPLKHMLVLIIPATQLKDFYEIYPVSILSLTLGILATATQATLDGADKVPTRSKIAIGANIAYLVSAYFLVFKLGLIGLAISQCIQYLTTIIIGWWFFCKACNVTPKIPKKINFLLLKDAKASIFAMQWAGLASLSIEPIIKTIITIYAGLSATGLYEMANQVVSKTKSILMAAFSAFLPRIANQIDSMNEMSTSYWDAKIASSLFGSLLFSTTACALPIISLAWHSHTNSQFITIGAIICASWILNTPTIAAFYTSIAMQRNAIVASIQSVAALLTLLLCYALHAYGVEGILIASAAALLLPNYILMVWLENRISRPEVINPLNSYVRGLFILNLTVSVMIAAASTLDAEMNVYLTIITTGFIIIGIHLLMNKAARLIFVKSLSKVSKG